LVRHHACRRTVEVRFGRDLQLAVGVETRTEPREYDWPGERRGDARHPTALFQFVLEGWGNFETLGRTHRVVAGQMFAAVIPSAHRYYLPVESRSWTFLWLMFRQPYVVERVRDRIATSGPFVTSAPDGPLVTKMARLFEGVCSADFTDGFALEAALFDTVLEWERACEQQTYPTSPRERLLADVRDEVLQRTSEPTPVEQLAARFGMSRTHFTHHFKATTGTSPAQFVTEVKLQAVARRLQQSDDKLATLAAEFAFADANHLCKVFRRHYRTSPGDYRKQFR
jgi:AraC-like DNA-binding protein